MAEATETKAGKEAPQGAAKGGTSLSTLVVAVLAAVLLAVGAVGAAGYWLVSSGKLPVGGGAAKVEAAVKPEPVKARLVTLDPMLVNLADEGGKSYLRVAMVLRLEDPPPVKGAKPKEEEKPEKGKVVVNESDVIMRDSALGVLGRQMSESLLAADGKERLKAELRAAMQQRVPEVKVLDVLFTEFLVQR